MSLNQAEVESCLLEIRNLTSEPGLDIYTQRALIRISQRLSEFASGTGSNSGQLQGLVARLVVEQDPSILSPELGGRLIVIEKAFYARNA